MPPGDPAFARATLQDLIAAEAEGRRVELLDGVLLEKEAAGSRHGGAHAGVHGALAGPFRGRGDGAHPGGWAFKIEPSVLAPTGDVVLPDVGGWRRDRAPSDDAFPVTVAPDWACEVVYSSHFRDIVQKHRIYHRMGVGHYWIVDLKVLTLTVYRWTQDGYTLVTVVTPHERARLEPFDAVELNAWELFGLEDRPEGPAV